MKLENTLKPTLMLIGAITFNALFWDAQIGINLLLFSLFLVGCIFLIHRNTKKSISFYMTLAGVLITGLFVTYHNSTMSKFTHILSFVLMIGFLNQLVLKSILFAFYTSLLNYIKIPTIIKNEFSSSEIKPTKLKAMARTLKLAVIPLAILFVFIIIFQFANPVFSKLTNNALDNIGNFFEYFFEQISFARLLFFLFGSSIVAWVIFKGNFNYYANKELLMSDIIIRLRRPKTNIQNRNKVNPNTIPTPTNTLGLKNEYRSALILLVMVNLLLLIINIIDINWIWFNFEYNPNDDLSSFVHEGTYLLILSTLLSIGILLFYFRGNQNFYHNRPTLVKLSNIWIIQNVILVISVALRNYHYIHYYGLAYKRIGVIIFLIITVAGLFTLYQKIRNKKSINFFIRINSWTVYASFIFMSCVNWDGIIAKNNIEHPLRQNMDIEFLMSLSDKTLSIIGQNPSILSSPQHWQNDRNNFQKQFDQRKASFLNRMSEAKWYSWNYMDYKTYNYFIQKAD
jgi:Domain of unknown function (DUF4173)